MFGTCAGLILLARDVQHPRQFSLGLIDVDVERNAYGRQRESFEVSGTAMLDGTPTPIEMMFIRAPRIRRVGEGVEVLARQGGDPVMAKQGTVLVATFHPEVTGEHRVHKYFCEMVSRVRKGG
jgi:5'-phosphate synthase pdxT subunit